MNVLLSPGVTQSVTTPPVPHIGMMRWDGRVRMMLVWDGTQWQSLRHSATPNGRFITDDAYRAALCEKYPTLEQAWNHFQIVLRMCESQENLDNDVGR